jgi:Domain of unknown function (DUF5666)
MKQIMFVCLALGLTLGTITAQDYQRQESVPMRPGDNVVGKVTAVSSDSLTVTPVSGADPVTIKVGENTRIAKDRQPVKLSEIKPDETVFARGQLNGTTLNAFMVVVVNPEAIQQMQQGPMGHFKHEDLGKKFIAGEVKAINETRLTIARPDTQSQDIEVDENTSFKKGSESITLPDIKVGDFVHGTGELKGGVFVPKELIVGRPRMVMMQGGPPPGEKKPESDKPGTAPKN